ncbi:hypothetical protein LX32DRAFT_691661 [Colletotrichum zoysiae]|uniref:Uncharacterized protein n=1 Tax=Colletotrichum zoysiae TaxID=1216348 RepID=A0AAD9HM47_9PEZI|nr:hypothetical protein LX32DRAFT_691661 [Colletotrichum zoysiae]
MSQLCGRGKRNGPIWSITITITLQSTLEPPDGPFARLFADEGDVPVYITASHLDDVVLAPTSNSHSYNYRSDMLFVHASAVEEPNERLHAMQLMTGRWEDTRVPPNRVEMISTAVYCYLWSKTYKTKFESVVSK